jgi:MFS family permease
MDDSAATAPQADQLPSMAYRGWFLFVMTLVSASVVAERYMMSVMSEDIKASLHLSDSQLAFTRDGVIALVYVIAVLPLARLADRWKKRKVIAMAAAIWSVAVIICSQAKSYALLLVGRGGIGLGEGAFTPPSQSWIADHFTIKERGTALALFLIGASAGQFLGPAFGGWMTQDYAWRSAFLYASIPGFILIPIVWFTLRDVRAGLADNLPVSATKPLPFVETVRELLSIKTFLPIVIVASLNALLTVGLLSSAPSFMARTYGMMPREAGALMGSAVAIGSVLGHTLGGPLSDWLGRRDLRWYVWILMLCGAVSAVFSYIAMNAPRDWVFPLFGINMLIGGTSAAPMMALVAGIAPARSRSVAVALLMISINVIGLGGGPVFVGWLSDILKPEYGQASLGVAMQLVLVVSVPSTILAWIASHYVRADLERAGGWTPGKNTMAAGH